MHTFGKDLKFNPHLHLITNFSDNVNSKFNKPWRYEVIKSLDIFDLSKYAYGFYVWCDNRPLGSNLAKYISRYVRHPAIANGRIIDYTKKGIIFYYKDTQDKKIYITKSITNFIQSLIQHIPPAQFKLIRYYGAYARNKKSLII